MANEIGSTLLNSLTNSTFDVGNMAKVLAEADVASQRSIVSKGATKATTELDALKYLEMNLKAVNTYVADLSSGKLFSEKQAASSNEGLVSVSASADASLGSYAIESRQLAQSHTLIANKAFSSSFDSLANGTLTLEVAGVSHDITVDASNNTLDGLQKTINSGDYGVTASVVNNGGSYQLMMTSKQSGASGEITLSGLPDFASGYTTTAQAQDAIMVINGLEVSNSSNAFDQVIEGVTFNLKGTALGQTNTVSISQDPQNAIDTIKSFVDVYNQLETIFDDVGKYDISGLSAEDLETDEYKYTGDLAGNSTLREVRSNLKSALSGSIAEISGNYNALSIVGIKFNLDGSLALDESKLTDVATNNMSALQQLFAKGGSSDDGLINVVGGSEKTQSGQYSVNITQLAERANITGGSATTTADEQVSGNRVTDSVGALALSSGATLDMTIGGSAYSVDFSAIAQTYSTKSDLATAIQTAINDKITLDGGSESVAVQYDAVQARFEILADVGVGALSITAANNMDKQGFVTGNSYSGQQLIDLSSAGASSFDMKVDDSATTSISLAAGRYTLEDLAAQMTANINNNATIKESGNSVSVTVSGGALNVASTRYGGYSNINLSNLSASFANSGLVAASDAGQNVDGTITTSKGTLNLGAYADSQDGRLIKISDYAIIGGDPASVRGLQFEVLGGALNRTANVSFAQGFASRFEETINAFFAKDTGVITRRSESLTTKLTDYDERNTALDQKFNKLELKYRLQFSMLQSIMSQSQSTRDQLTAQFSNGS